MLRVAFSSAVLLVMLACTSQPGIYETLAERPTPKTWATPSVWRFELVDTERNRLGNVTLDLTSGNTASCLSGSWQSARVLSSSGDVFGLNAYPSAYGDRPKTVAYRIEGMNLVVNLNSAICDNNILMYGMLEEGTASGRVDHSFMLGGEHRGWFTASPINR